MKKFFAMALDVVVNSKVKAVFLDIGGVVLEIDWRRTLLSLGINDPTQQRQISQSFMNWEVHHQYERGQISNDEFLKACQTFFPVEVSSAKLEKAWHAIIVGLIEGIDDVIKKYSEHVPFYTLSNTNRLHFDRFSQEYPVFKDFEEWLTSFDLGERKPDFAIYQLAAEKLDLSPSECLFIDDLSENVEAARKVGFKAEVSLNSAELTEEIIRKYV